MIGWLRDLVHGRPPAPLWPGDPYRELRRSTLLGGGWVMLGIVHLGPTERIGLELTERNLSAYRETEGTDDRGRRRLDCVDAPIQEAAAWWARTDPRWLGVLPPDPGTRAASFDAIVAAAAVRCEEDDE